MVKAVHVRRIRGVSALRTAVPLFLRPGDQEQDVRGDRQPVRIIQTQEIRRTKDRLESCSIRMTYQRTSYQL